MFVRKIRPEEYKRCQALWAVCFEYRMKHPEWTPEAVAKQARENPQSRQEAALDNTWAAFDDGGTMMGALTAIPWEASFEGHTVRMDGVGGVATLPEFRGQGAVRRCFGAALPAMYADGALLSYLYPFSTAFYGRFGYAPGCERVVWSLALAGLPGGDVPGRILPVSRGSGSVPDLMAVDAARRARYNLLTVDGEQEYRWADEAPRGAQRAYSYVYRGAGDVPKGYITWVPVEEGGERVLDVKRFACVDREGLAGLLALLRRLSPDHGQALLRLPPDLRLERLLPELLLGRVRQTVEPWGMVRAVNAAALLRLKRARGSGALNLALTDPMIPENDGCFRVEFGVGPENRVTRTDAPPDVRMDIRAFSRAICGLEDGVDPAWQAGVEVSGDPDAANRLFCRQPCWIEQFF